MKTIKQLSTEFGISKEAIYKKLKFQLREELKGHVFKVDNVTRVDEEGERLMRQSLHKERREALENVMGQSGNDGIIDVELVEVPSGQSHLTEYVTLLKEQVRAKDVQIETQSGHIGQLIRQLGVVQLLSQGARINELSLANGQNFETENFHDAEETMAEPPDEPFDDSLSESFKEPFKKPGKEFMKGPSRDPAVEIIREPVMEPLSGQQKHPKRPAKKSAWRKLFEKRNKVTQ